MGATSTIYEGIIDLEYKKANPNSPIGRKGKRKTSKNGISPTLNQIAPTEKLTKQSIDDDLGRSTADAKLVFKFSAKPFTLIRELRANRNLPEQFKVGWTSEKVCVPQKDDGHVLQFKDIEEGTADRLTLIIGRQLFPLQPSSFTAAEYEIPSMDRKLVLSLLENLEHIHTAGWVHRDLRPQNILLRPASNGLEEMFILSDFGLAEEENVETTFSGSVSTASMRVLGYLINKKSEFTYTKHDDLESFYKMLTVYFYKLEPPSDLKELYVFWEQDYGVRHLNQLKTTEEMILFIKDFFRVRASFKTAHSNITRLERARKIQNK